MGKEINSPLTRCISINIPFKTLSSVCARLPAKKRPKAVHREAHGGFAGEVIEVKEGM